MKNRWMSSLKQHASSPPFLLQYRSSRWFILTTICLAVFTDIFLDSLIAPVAPFALTGRAGVPQEDVQHWVSILLAAYGVALLVASPVFGWLADHSKSRRLPLIVGLVALAGSTAMLCIGSSIGVLVAGRFLQGLSAAVVWVVGLALLVDTIGERDIGQYMGYVSLSTSMGILAGPLLGGVVYEKAGYYSVFAMAFALLGLDIFLRLAMVEKKIAKQWLTASEPQDDGDQAAPTPPHLLDNGYTRSSPIEEKPTDDGIHGIPSETKKKTRMSRFTNNLPPVVTLLHSRRLVTALWGCLVQASLLTSFDSVLPLFVRRTFGWSSTGAGLIFLPLVIPSFAAPIIGWLSDKYGPRWLAVSGFLLALPFFTLLRLVTHDTIPQIVVLCVLIALIGFSVACVLPPLMAEITYIVQAKEKENPGMFGSGGAYAQAYGLFNCAYAGGCVVGPIWAGFVEDKAGWGTMAWSLGLLSALSAIPTMIWTGGLITERHDNSDSFRGDIYDKHKTPETA